MPQPSPTGHPRSTAPARRVGTTAAAAARAVVSFAVLVLLLAGLPLVLWWGTTIVGPPGLAALGHLFTTQDSGQVFLLALAALGWIGWGLFTLSVLVEIPAQLRGRTAPQLRLLIGQRTAAALISAILMALPTGTALAAAATPAQAAAPVATATAHPGNPGTPDAPALAGAGQSASEQVPGQGTVAYTVQDARPAESLWSIAEVRLGDGNRWEEIADLNAGSTMSDGTVFHADAVIRPGWTLQLPTDADTHVTPPAKPAAAAPTADGQVAQPSPDGEASEYTVHPGDNLSQIAEDELGDGARYPQIFELNKGELQPGGQRFTDPDVIYPGQHLDLPSTQHIHDQPPAHANEAAAPPSRADGDRASATPHPTAAATDQPTEAAPAAPLPTGETTATPLPDSAAPRTSAPQPDASPTRQSAPAFDRSTAAEPSDPAPEPAASTAGTSQSQPRSSATIPAAAEDDGQPVGIKAAALAAGVGMLLAASLAGSLAVKRILQHRRRRAGETIAIDPDPTRLEQVLNTSGPAGVALLDSVLRTLAAQAATDGHDLPAVRGARVTDRTVHLTPDDPTTPALTPFTTTSAAPGTWVLDPAQPLLPADTARTTPAPFPALVTIGASMDGDLILINLLHSKALLLEGEPDDVLAVARALALEAGTAGWTDHTDIVTVGLGSRLATLLPQGRMQTKPHLPSVTADLGALLVEVHQQGDGGAPIDPLPWILIGAGDIDAEQAWHLADALAAARNLPVAIVLPACDATRRAFPDAEQIPVSPDTDVALPDLSPDPIQLQRLTDEQYRQYIHALEAADQPAKEADGAWQLAEDHDLTAPTPRPGPVLVQAVAGPGGTDPGHFFPALLNHAEPHRNRATDTGQEKATEQDEATAQDSPPLPLTEAETAPGTGALPEQTGPEESEQAGPPAPAINILGPLQVTGITASGHGPKVAALAALIFLRPGRTGEFLCTAMDPVSPWSTRTLQSRLSEIRTRLGNTPDGDPYLPRPRNGGYQFTPGVRSDWTRFQDLATRSLAAGPGPGIVGLEAALALVRGKPFDGQDYPWADAFQHEIRARITDIAHTLATWHADPESQTLDLDAARTAVLQGLDIDETAEVLYRDWMTIEWAADNHAGIRKAVARVQQTARTYDISLEPLTEQTIDLVLSDRAAHAGRV